MYDVIICQFCYFSIVSIYLHLKGVSLWSVLIHFAILLPSAKLLEVLLKKYSSTKPVAFQFPCRAERTSSRRRREWPVSARTDARRPRWWTASIRTTITKCPILPRSRHRWAATSTPRRPAWPGSAPSDGSASIRSSVDRPRRDRVTCLPNLSHKNCH